MKFDTPASTNPIDQMKVIGQPEDRVEGKLKTTGTATYAYEQQATVSAPAYGYVLGASIGKGRISSIDSSEARQASGVIAIVTYENAGHLDRGEFYVDRALAGPEVDHYHQAVAIVVAQTFEQARAASALLRVHYVKESGAYDIAAQRESATTPAPGAFGPPPHTAIGISKAHSSKQLSPSTVITPPRIMPTR
jgi:xanthine dehydrogenase YagR molybdenum-binding subunit